MKAIQIKKYNKNNINMEIVDVARPRLEAGEVLVKVSTAGVNPVDNMITRGEVKLILPFNFPLTTGNELVGYVEEVSSDSKYKVGDRVFAKMRARKAGAFAQYVAVKEEDLAKVPEYMTDEEAAAVPLTALTAMQSFELLEIESGKTIFISGGTGGFGQMAIPLAKAKGLKVITNGNGINRNRVIALGADQFIDYKTEDYSQVLKDVDYVIDTLGGRETEKQFSILKEGGTLVSLKGIPNGDFAKRFGLSKIKQFLFGLVGKKLDKLAAKKNQKYKFVFVEADGGQLQEVADIFERIQLKPSVEKVYDFTEINQALTKVDAGHAKGKTVIKF